MNYAEQGALGGVVYLFLSAACPLAGYLFKNYNAKVVMAFTIMGNAFATLMLGLTPAGHTSLLIVFRACIGFSQVCETNIFCVISDLISIMV
jgi:MFS family permease